MKNSRRDFIKKTALGTAAITLPFSAKSYNNIIGANDRVNFGVVGINSRGKEVLRAITANKNTSVGFLCDVDSRVISEVSEMTKKLTGKAPTGIADFRKLLEEKDLDAIAIATPEHWHAPMAIMGAQAGKHVYVEKPCSHNPKEGEMLLEVKKKTGKVIQVGTQQRSAPTSLEAIRDIKEGIIGQAYYGKAWYSNKRGSIGKGKKVAVPDWLNWELWQGPAPRRDFQDIWVHYNWHWFWDYGTGEIHNNGTHEIDICRWALGVKYPVKVSSAGGRFHFDDDWEFYDTQNVSYEFAGGKMITWEGKSCNPFEFYGKGRGVTIHGTKGTILLDRNEYIAYDLDGKVIKQVKESGQTGTTDIVGGGDLTVFHMANMLDAIRKGTPLNASIEEAHVTNMLCHYGNYSQKVGRTLRIDPHTGYILGDGEAMQLWGREYEPGWEPKV